MPVSVEEILKDYRRAKRELEEERRRETMICEHDLKRRFQQ